MTQFGSDRILAGIQVDGDLTENMRAIRDNMGLLQGKLLGQAAQVLGDKTLEAAHTPTTSFAIVPGSDFSITTSGGLVVLFAQVCSTYADLQIFTNITIDGEVKASCEQAASTPAILTTDPIFWAGNITAGKHTVALQSKYVATGGSTVATINATYTRLWALEFIS